MKWLSLLTFLVLWCGCSRPNAPIAAIPSPELSTLDPALAGLITNAQSSARSNPSSAEAWGKLGQVFEAAEFSDDALRCYSRASELDPNSARWRYLLGLSQLATDSAAALTNLVAAAAVASPTNDAVRLRLAQVLIERGNYSEAKSHLTTLLIQNTNHPAGRLELARIHLANGDPKETLRMLPPALTNNYTARPALILASQAQYRLGNTNEAQRSAQTASSMAKPFDWPDPFRREVQNLRMASQDLASRVNTLLMQGRTNEAERLLGEMLDRSGTNTEALLLLGRLRIQQRRCDEAESLLIRHLNVRTNSLQAFVQLGLARYCQGRWADATEAFRSAVTLKPDFAAAHYNLGLALARQNNQTAAIEALQTALRCQPGDANTYAALADQYLRLGDASQAEAHARQSLSLNSEQPMARQVLNTITGKR